MSDLQDVDFAAMYWLVKAEFVRYVLRVGGRIDCNQGARVVQDVGIHFPLKNAHYHNETDAITAEFSGGVRFRAHGGFLDLTLSNPVIDFRGRSGVLRVSVASDGLAYPAASFAVLEAISKPYVDDESLWFSGISAAVTSFGAQMLGDVYQEGTPLAPVTMQLPKGEWSAGAVSHLASSGEGATR